MKHLKNFNQLNEGFFNKKDDNFIIEILNKIKNDHDLSKYDSGICSYSYEIEKNQKLTIDYIPYNAPTPPLFAPFTISEYSKTIKFNNKELKVSRKLAEELFEYLKLRYKSKIN
jgi:hypothetical protein